MPPIDIRDHVSSLIWRDLLKTHLDDRRDIIALAPILVRLQDGDKLDSDETERLQQVLDSLPSYRVLSAALTPGEEFDPDRSRRGARIKIPGGVRHEHLHFSPILQIARLQSQDGCVSDRWIPELPSTKTAIMDWLLTSCGFALPPVVLTEAQRNHIQAENDLQTLLSLRRLDEEDFSRDFELRYGFTLDQLASWLLYLRSSDPVLFVQLLSREFVRASERESGIKRENSKAHFPKSRRPPLYAMMAIAELQRLRAIITDLCPDGMVMTTEMVRPLLLFGPHAKAHKNGFSRKSRNQGMGSTLVAGDPRGRVLHETLLQAGAIQRLMAIPSSRLQKMPRDQLWQALALGHSDWDASLPGQQGVEGARMAAHENVASLLSAEVMQPRVRGKGMGYHDLPLDLYYGVRPWVLIHLALLEIGKAATGTLSRESSKRLGERVVAALFGAREKGEESCHKEAVKALSCYRPPYPEPGCEGRFVPALWLRRGHDRQWLEGFIEPMPLEILNKRHPRNRWVRDLAILMLQKTFEPLYRYAPRDRLWPIATDLLTGVTFFTRDPLFRAATQQVPTPVGMKELRRRHKRATRRKKGKGRF